MDGLARLWDRSGRLLLPPLRHSSSLVHGAFSPDGRSVVTLTDRGFAQVWNAGTGEPEALPVRLGSGPGRVEFAADGRGLLFALDAGEAGWWPFPVAGGSAGELTDLATALTGLQPAAAGPVPAPVSRLVSLHARVRARFPARFSWPGAPTWAQVEEEATRCERARAWGPAAERLRELVRKAPRDGTLWRRLAVAQAQARQWERAAAAFGEARRLGESECVLYYSEALARLGAGDPPGYRRVCREMLTRFAVRGSRRERELTTWTCALAPLPAEPAGLAVRLAQEEMRQSQDNSKEWAHNLGLLLLRQGDPGAALPMLLQSLSGREQEELVILRLCIGLCQAHLGRFPEAEAAVRRVEGRAGEEWGDYLECQLLRAELARLLTSQERAP